MEFPFHRKWPELKKILTTLDNLPDVICIQESHLTSKYRPSIPNYCLIRKDRPPSKGKGGGLILCVKSSLEFSEIDVTLPTGNNLEMLGVTVHGFSVLSIYNPPSNILVSTTFALSNFASVILCGDFNSHHGMWGSKCTNSNGRAMVDVIDKHDFVVLNTTTPTHFSLSGQIMWSLLDLVLVSTSCASICASTAANEFLGSGHSIVLTTVKATTTSQGNAIPKWNFSKADWLKFSNYCDQTLSSVSISLEYSYCLFKTSVREGAQEAIPQSKRRIKLLFHGGIHSVILQLKTKNMLLIE